MVIRKFLKQNILFTVILCIAAILGAMYLFDYRRAESYDIEVLEITPERPVADGQTPVEITVKLTKRGKEIEGHSLYMVPKNGGNVEYNRCLTDENGEAKFIYYPYKATVLMPAKTVEIRVYDESNSIFVVVNTCYDFPIELVKE